MTLESSINLINDSYHAQVGLTKATPEALTPLEKLRIGQFGEPVVACGGAINGVNGNAQPVIVTLPANSRRFPSQFPVKTVFSIADYGAEAALSLAVDFRSKIVTAVTAAMTATVAKTPGSIGTDIQTINVGGN